jgi:hypothetical protein
LNKWIAKDGDRYTLSTVSSAGDIVDVTQKSLKALSDGNFTKDAIDEKVNAVWLYGPFFVMWPFIFSKLPFVLVYIDWCAVEEAQVSQSCYS